MNMESCGNKEYGWITLLHETERRDQRNVVWKCRCRCGNIIYRSITSLRRAVTKNKSGITSCGCARQKNYTGLVKGNLTAIKTIYKNEQREMVWLFRCSCGNEVERVAADVYRGEGALHCGCISKPRGEHSHSYKGYKGLTGTYWSRLKYNAVKRGLDFNITREYTWNILLDQNMKCSLTGYDISNGTDASLDRIDSTKGYIKNNIQWVHKHINWMKRDHSQDNFIKLCKDVYEHTRAIK